MKNEPIGLPDPWIIERLKRDFKFDPETGILVRTSSVDPKAKLGVDVSVRGSGGYRALSIHDPSIKGTRAITIHRIGWFLHYGEWPCRQIDHINGNNADNRIANLRYCTHSQNQGNAKLRSDNTSGYKGVGKTRVGRYAARIKVGNNRLHLGTFDTALEAHEAYSQAAIRLFGQFARPAIRSARDGGAET